MPKYHATPRGEIVSQVGPFSAPKWVRFTSRSPGTFIQVLEGDDETVESTFNRISKDPRHSKIVLIAKFELDHRSFNEWEMGFFDASGGQLLKLPGYTSFLSRKTVELEEPEDGDKAREVLINFKHGAWHR